MQNVPLRFVLPGTSHLVEATGRVIWADDDGRAGMFFSGLTAASRHHLKNWLTKRGSKTKNAVRVLLPQKTRRSAQASHLGNLAYEQKRRLAFDTVREEILPL